MRITKIMGKAFIAATWNRSTARAFALSACLAMILCTPTSAQIATLKRLFKASSHVEVPRSLDEIAERATRDVHAESSAFEGVRVGLDADSAVARLARVCGRISPADVEALRAMPPESLARVVQWNEGAKILATDVPDLALRARLLEKGGPELLEAAAREPGLVTDFVRMESLLSGKSVVAGPSGAVPLLSDVGRFFNRTGSAGARVFKETIWPNRKALAQTGLLAWFILAPDYFIDTAGNLTEKGAKALVEVGGVVVARGIDGASAGSEAARDEISRAATRAWSRGIIPMLGVFALFVVVMALAFARIRAWVLRPFHWLRKAPTPPFGNDSDE